MLRIREFEERVKRTFEEHPGVIRGHTHLADGAEASIVGSLATLRDGDQLLTTYRCHGYPIALGTDTKAMMAEIYGRTRRSVRRLRRLDAPGRPGRADFSGTSGIVGQGIPHATGVAYAAQIRKQGQVVLCFFGDGASKQGAFHESLNLASLWKLPVVYVMENNSYNVATRSEQEDANAAAGEPLSVKAKAYSMPGVTVDGGDPIAVYETVSAAVERARARRRTDAGGVQGLPPVGPRQPDRAARGAAALPRARGDHGVRQPRGVRGGAARRPGAPLPRAPDRAGHAERRARRRDRPGRPATRWRRPCSSGSTARSPSRKRPLNHVYA